MLFHVTLTHDAAHCPGYHPELGPSLGEAYARKDEVAQQLGVKVHSILNAAPDHVIYVIAEGERPMAVAQFVSRLIPFEQADIRMTAVETLDDTMAFLQAMRPA